MREFATKATRVWPWLAATATGLLCTACFPPFNIGWICWIALTPLISAIWFSRGDAKRRWLRNLLLGYVGGLVFFTAAFSWLGSLGVLFESPPLRGLSFLLAIYLGMHFAFWAWFVGLITPREFLSSGKNLLVALVAASAWGAHEWVRGWLFSGFGWNGFGVALYANWPMIQIAEFTGVAGLSFVIAFANIIAVTTALRLFHETRTRRMQPHFDLTLTMLALVGLFAFGLHRIQFPARATPLRVAAVQPNVPQLQKFDPQFARTIFERFANYSAIALQANPPVDLIVWPESSMPDLVRDQTTLSYRFVMDFASSSRADLLLGALDSEDRHDYNAALLVAAGGHAMQIYRKLHLVPFGEYVPLRHSFPLFAAIASRWVPADFEVGREFTVFRLTNANVSVAPLICFEDTIGELTRRFVLRGANLLVNMTNDAWYLQSAGSQQHLANAVFRCVETRRPMLRAANTGVTCFINEFGRITQVLRDENGGTFTEGVLTGEVNVPQEPALSDSRTGRQLTFYTRHGELFAKICAGVTAIAVVSAVLRRRWIGRSAGDVK
ncbi:MAG TPA: apolipoprotein N-acyltransferase [Chthoniobacterales bacterium]|nr:apolipoprotein N-acyltransferase [Chthoniobacterales bacterium]